MVELFVNGESVLAREEQKLMPYLRDELRLTSVKNGCAEGACGTCTVIIDGKAQKACVQRMERLAGKKIITVEGLSPREKDVYAYAFSEAGAVQCGFCIPGMVMCAKALIDACPKPTREQVCDAIKNNICRCTGYKKIEKAILLAAELIKSGASVPQNDAPWLVGENVHRVDAAAKTLGEAKYADDYYFDGMVFASAVRSAYPRARVLSIDAREARAQKGVLAVILAEDIPGKQKIGHLTQDWDVLIPVGKITHYMGDSVALVVAKDEETLERAKSLVKVEYEELAPLTSPEAAMAEGAPLVHESGNILSVQRLKRGDADEAIKNSKYKVTARYSTPFTEHAFLEPECAVAFIEDDTVRIISGDQGIYQTRKECAAMLGLELEGVRVTAALVGGGFGGKEDMSVQHHAALAAYLLKRPVKVRLSRKESILVHPKRHAMEMTFTTACDENGILTGMKAELISDTGAYASLGGPVLQRACTHAAGPYNYQNVDIIGKAVYTNNPPAGAFRGFGVTQSCFATEMNLNKLARLVGISPFEIRYRNAIRPGQVLPNGQIADASTALVETLDAVRAEYENNPSVGIACAMKNAGLGVGIPDVGRCDIAIIGGKAHVRSSAACIGQGMGTVQLQMICSEASLPRELVIYDAPDTAYAPDAGNTTASRQTVFTGEAAKRAAKLLSAAIEKTGKSPVNALRQLEGEVYHGEFAGATDPMNSDKPNPVSHVAYGYATHLTELDEAGRVKRVIAVHDIGEAVNPRALEGQIEGGVTMSLGYALTEDYPLDNGRPTAKFGTLGLFRSNITPEIVVRLVGHGKNDLAFGAKGVGEIASIPTAPSVALAYENRDGEERVRLPLKNTPYKK